MFVSLWQQIAVIATNPANEDKVAAPSGVRASPRKGEAVSLEL